jgi:hypothetical protein
MLTHFNTKAMKTMNATFSGCGPGGSETAHVSSNFLGVFSNRTRSLFFSSYLLVFLILVSSTGSAWGQISYSFNFDANSTGWTGGFTRFTGTTACGGTGGAMRRNLYSGATTGQLISPITGTSNGASATVSYTYKAAIWSANTTAATNWGSFDVQYGATATGPWTTFATVSNEAQLGNACISKSHTVTLPAGATFIRFAATWQSGDYYLNFDNVSVVQSAGSACSGTPAPGNTIASPTSVAPGGTVALSLQNATAGSGVTYQWQSGPSSSGPWTNFGTSAATQTSPAITAGTWFRCLVTCAGNTGTSNPVQVTLAYCQPSGTGLNTSITNFATSGGITNISNASTFSAGGYGNFTALSCSQQAGLTVSFTLAYGSDPGSAIYIDWNNDLDFVDAGEQVYTSNAFVLSGTSGTFTVPAGQAAGNYRMRVVIDWNAFIPVSCPVGINGEIEDYTFTVAAPPACLAPSSPSGTPLTLTSATVSWTAPSPAPTGGYEYAVTTSATPPASGTATTATSLSVTGLPPNITYYLHVRSNCDASGFSTWATSVSFRLGYCVPSTSSGCTDGDVVARVVLNTLDNNSGTGCPSGLAGYSDYTSDPLLTTTLLPSTTYNCTVYAGQYPQGYAAWIDYNDDGVFDNATERIGYSNGLVAGSGSVGVLGSSAAFPISLACNPPAGAHRLRVRSMYNTNGINVTPCGSNTWGETEDYTITIAAAPACPSPGLVTTLTPAFTSASITFATGCSSATNYDFEYGPAGFTPGTGTLLSNQAVTISAPNASYTLTGLTDGTSYTVYYRANCGASQSAWSIANNFSTQPIPVCVSAPTSPANGSSDCVSGSATTLSWPSAANATVYDVYLNTGSSATTLVSADQAGTTYNAGVLPAGNYAWRIVPKNGSTGPSGCSDFTFTVNPNLTASVSLAANNTAVCSGVSVTFTATPTNEGTAPTYEWRKNGTAIAGASGASYSGVSGTDFVNGDVITVVMTSNATPCLVGSPATSNDVTMTVNPILNASVSLAADNSSVCSAMSVTFTATPVNGGSAPSYAWFKNGTAIAGASGATYTGLAGTDFVNGDVISCQLTSNATPCLAGSPATSNGVTMTVNAPVPTNTAGTYASGSVNIVDGTTVEFLSSCVAIGKTTDASGGNVPGNTTMTATVVSTMQSTNPDGWKYVRRSYTSTTASDGQRTLTFYFTQEDFDDYNANNYGSMDLPTSGNNADPNKPYIRLITVTSNGYTVSASLGVNLTWNGTYWQLTKLVPSVNGATYYISTQSSCEGVLVNGLAAGNISATNATLSWTAISPNPSSGYYQLRYKPTASSTWVDGGTANYLATSRTYSTLSPGTQYEFQIRRVCSSDGFGAWSSSVILSTISSGCGSPMVFNAPTSTSSTVTLSWPAVTGAAWFQFQYKESSSGTWLSAGTLTGTGTTRTVSGLNPNTSYDFRGRTYCPNNAASAWSTTVTATTTGQSGCALPPVLTVASLTGTSATITWPVVQGASWYEFRYKLSSSSTWISAGTLSGAGTQRVLSGLTSGTQYDFQARTFCASGVPSSWSTTLQFTTTGALGCETAPVLTLGTVTNTTATFTWPAISGAAWFEFRYKLTSSNTWISAGTSSGTATSKTLTGLTANTQYDFQARTFCANGNPSSAWSATRQFTTTGAAAIALAEGDVIESSEGQSTKEMAINEVSGVAVNVFPNPTDDMVQVQVIIEQANETLVVRVFDMSGRLVQEAQTLTEGGLTTIPLSMGEMMTGMYNVELYQNGALIHRARVQKN